MVLDGIKGKEYDYVGYPIFSPDSKRFTYTAQLEGRTFVVVDGIEGRAYQEGGHYFTFSPDSKHFAYVTLKRAWH